MLYRTLINVVGSYVTVALVASHPTRYVLGLGVLGTLASVGAAKSIASSNHGPAWYAWSLAVLVIPATLLGGKLSVKHGKAACAIIEVWKQNQRNPTK